jgi:hypothetical protein
MGRQTAGQHISRQRKKKIIFQDLERDAESPR